mmetsp:Transcript_38252/g.88238  ORF Transcript_38252/g.88238 Transcript_38252/m.88238 type:complete len:236 (-) Transcript_38252:516-1223(-)
MEDHLRSAQAVPHDRIRLHHPNYPAFHHVHVEGPEELASNEGGAQEARVRVVEGHVVRGRRKHRALDPWDCQRYVLRYHRGRAAQISRGDHGEAPPPRTQMHHSSERAREKGAVPSQQPRRRAVREPTDWNEVAPAAAQSLQVPYGHHEAEPRGAGGHAVHSVDHQTARQPALQAAAVYVLGQGQPHLLERDGLAHRGLLPRLQGSGYHGLRAVTGQAWPRRHRHLVQRLHQNGL